MKNLNKFTKAELISKFKKLETQNSSVNDNNNQTISTRLVDFILYLKALILKITLITILIRTLKKYSLISKLLRFANWIILSIFGISIIDNFGLDFFRNFFIELRVILANIISYFSSTNFYSFLESLFKSKEEVTKPKVSIREDPVSWENSRTESEIRENKRNSKISEWLKPEPEIIQEESSNKKYYIIAGVLILACLSWYYWDEVRTVGPFLQDYFRRARSRDDGDGGSNPGLNTGDILPRLDNSKPSVEQRLLDYYNNKEIELIDNTKNIASGSNVKLDTSPSSENSMNHYFKDTDGKIQPQLTGLREITGNHYTSESASVIQEIDTFTSYHENASFPKAVVGAGLYSLIRERLHRLSEVSEARYSQLVQDDEIYNKINRFIDLEKEVFGNENINDQNIVETQSDTYEEVALANVETTNAWSDKATPSVHSQDLSPVSQQNNLDTQSIHSQNLSPDQSGTPQNNLDTQSVHSQDLADLFKRDNQIERTVFLVDNPQTSSQVLPEIDIDSGESSNSSMNQYFSKPEISQEEVKPKYTFNDLLDSIKARRDDSNVVGSPNVSQLGLSPKLSPLNTKPSISNLFDDTTALFDDDDVVETIDTSIDKGKAKEVSDNKFSYIGNPWEDIKTNVHYGNNPNNIIVDLEYGDLWRVINKFRFIMNSGQVIDYDYFANTNILSKTFDLSSDIQTTTSSNNIEIKEILIFDLNDVGNSVWKNSKYFS